MKRLLKNLLVCTMLAVLLVPTQQIHAQSSQISTEIPQTPPKNIKIEKEYKSVDNLKVAVKNGKNVNILIYDNENKIINELHSDGLAVDYKYANGQMIESTDSLGFTEKYEKENGKLKVHVFKDNKLIESKDFEATDSNAPISTNSIGVSNVFGVNLFAAAATNENYIVKGIDLNTLMTDSEYTNYNSMTSTSIQSFLESYNSILKDTILVYRKSSSGSIYFDGTTIKPSVQIYSSAYSYKVNPKLILVMIQKESSLIKAVPGQYSYTDRRFYYVMGYGATDAGDIQGTSGFDKQISKGTQLLRSLFDSSPSTMPSKFTPINYNRSITINSVTYPNYIWVRTRATYALFRYTPHAFDLYLYDKDGTIGGGNLLVKQIFNGFWSTWN